MSYLDYSTPNPTVRFSQTEGLSGSLNGHNSLDVISNTSDLASLNASSALKIKIGSIVSNHLFLYSPSSFEW